MKGVRGRGTAVMQRTPTGSHVLSHPHAPPSLSVSFLSVPPRPYTSSGPRTNISRQDEEANRRWWGWRLGGVEGASYSYVCSPPLRLWQPQRGLHGASLNSSKHLLRPYTVFALASLHQKPPGTATLTDEHTHGSYYCACKSACYTQTLKSASRKTVRESYLRAHISPILTRLKA